MKHLSLTLALIFCVITAHAEIFLPNVFQNNMVLQQKTTVTIWGWGNPAEKITVKCSWNDKTVSTNCNNLTEWKLDVETPQAGGPYQITIQGSSTIVLENVLIGEVWLCAGQSNMEWNAQLGVADALAELPSCKNDQIRFLRIPKQTGAVPQSDFHGGKWTVCDSATLWHFSAVGYFFGKKINSTLKVPVGLIDVSWGGSYIESWIASPVFTLYPELKTMADKIPHADWWPQNTASIFNGMVAPLVPFQIAGTLWYQGESNRYQPKIYDLETQLMVDTWRKLWKKDFAFYYVQIAPYNYKDTTENRTAAIREMQTKSMSIPNSGMVVTTDVVNDLNNIHPIYKKPVGERLANWALAETYKQPVSNYKSPQYKSMRVEKNKIVLTFDNVANGLAYKGASLLEFKIAGDDQRFVTAEARIVRNNEIEVWSNAVAKPVAVRFAFHDIPVPNVFSSEGLPVIPFRTDSWPLSYEKK